MIKVLAAVWCACALVLVINWARRQNHDFLCEMVGVLASLVMAVITGAAVGMLLFR